MASQVSTPSPNPKQTTPAVVLVATDAAKSATGDPSHASTPIHAPRVFFYFSLFFVPLVFSIAFLSSPTIYRATNVSTQLQPTLFFSDSYIGLIRICTDDPTSNCRYIQDVCKDVKEDKDPFAIDLSDALCGGERKAAAAFAILAVIAGAAAMLAYIDNILVWRNLSFWYQPRAHTTHQVTRVRDSFRLAILILASLHASFLLIAIILSIDLRPRIRQSLNVELFWGLWMGVAAVITDAIFVVAFMVFDKLTFFTINEGGNLIRWTFNCSLFPIRHNFFVFLYIYFAVSYIIPRLTLLKP
ncbi:hypothetical protein BC829DRAFT_417876 [Chytridium lagenaria]|nr:hypothetical protein BC829DRAFT_417876 [Chytridium lagenaria]